MNSLLLFIILILVVVCLFLLLGNKKTVDNKIIENDDTSKVVEVLGNEKDLVDFSIEPGSKVSGTLIVTGSVQGGYFFEGNILINVLDKNKKVVKAGFGSAKTDWMTSDPVGFEAVVDFTGSDKGQAYIEIHNDNASGLPEKDKSILIPVVIN